MMSLFNAVTIVSPSLLLKTPFSNLRKLNPTALTSGILSDRRSILPDIYLEIYKLIHNLSLHLLCNFWVGILFGYLLPISCLSYCGKHQDFWSLFVSHPSSNSDGRKEE